MSDKRKKLPTRRLSEVRKVALGEGRNIFITVGYDPKAPTEPKEVFYDSGFREGAELQFIATDICIMVSVCLQAGYTPEKIAKSLSKVTHDRPGGEEIDHGSMVGVIVAQLAIPPLWDQEAEE
ncbi:MAG: hypothetical protein QNK92_01560 [Amylibacter sp.]